MRVHYLNLGETKVKVIGDVHLGRRFVNGVPLDRRGDREKMVLDQFKRELRELHGATIVIQIGDLFDKFTVNNEVLMDTYDAIAQRAKADFFFIQGNHDASNDFTKVSSFQILTQMAADVFIDVTFVDEPIRVAIGPGKYIGLVPFQPGKKSHDLVEEIDFDFSWYEAVFGHWDLHSFGDEAPNLIPIEYLKKLTNLAVTGHEHKPVTAKHGELQVICTGSMQPYAFGEEAEGEDMYLTLSLIAVKSIKLDLKNRCVRLLLEKDDPIPEIDCLQLVVKRAGADETVADIDVEIGEFNMDALFDEAFTEVPETLAAEFKVKFKEVHVS